MKKKEERKEGDLAVYGEGEIVGKVGTQRVGAAQGEGKVGGDRSGKKKRGGASRKKERTVHHLAGGEGRWERAAFRENPKGGVRTSRKKRGGGKPDDREGG